MPGITPADEEKFPSLASRITLAGRCYMEFLPLFFLCWFLLVVVGGAVVPALRQAITGWVSLLFLATFVPLFLFLAPSQFRSTRLATDLGRKGYQRFSMRLSRQAASEVLDPALLRRVPPFSEIEHTPYNDPNDPDALLRMLDDLAAQMDAEPPAAKPSQA